MTGARTVGSAEMCTVYEITLRRRSRTQTDTQITTPRHVCVLAKIYRESGEVIELNAH